MAPRRVHEREALDAFDKVETKALSVKAWRVSWKSRDPLAGSLSGRWNPPGSMETLYTSLDRDGALAEVYHHLSLAPVRSSAEKLLYPLTVKTRNTLILDTPAKLKPFGLDTPFLALTDVAKSRELGAVAQLLGFDALLVPSARWECLNLILFPELLGDGVITPGKPSPINWPAWRERNGAKLQALWDRQRRARRG